MKNHGSRYTPAVDYTVLAVGVATLDIINFVDRYPPEDRKVRALDQRVSRGGNSANTLEVLARRGHRCRWAGVLVDEPDGRRITSSLDEFGIDYSGARLERTGKVPTSYITASRVTGSRTVVHYRAQPEFSAEDFSRIPLGDLHWLHIEGRAPGETRSMIHRVRRERPELPISLEFEKPRPGIDTLIDALAEAPQGATRILPEVLIFNRDFVTSRGYTDAEPFLRECAPAGATCFCTWGVSGAWVRTRTGDLHHHPAWEPSSVVDTIGAGDVFNAGVIEVMLRREDPLAALAHATHLAGMKCGQVGFEGLDETETPTFM